MNYWNGQRLSLSRGFTLMEMLLVIVIIGILVGGVAVSLSGRSQEAMVTRAKADVSGHLALALDLFETDLGRYPTEDEGLQVLVSSPGDSNWRGPYLKGELESDPWGMAYQYSLDTENTGRYLIRSAGPDRQFGNDDDITN